MPSVPSRHRCVRLKPLSSTVLLLLALLGQQAQAHPPSQVAASVQVFDVPAQALDASLLRIATEGGERVSLDSDLLQGRQAQAVRGRMSAEAAMRQALAGSGLELVRTASGALSVRRVPVPSGEAGKAAGVALMPAIEVDGGILGDSREQDVRTYAGARTVLDAEMLAASPYRSLDDALQHVPGIKILDETGTGVLPQIMMRGLYESRSGRVQVLQDGIPLSLAPYGQTSLSLFPVTMNQVDRIDVVRGGAAVQYGPNNVGGVINLVSKPIPGQWTTTVGNKVTAGGAGHFLNDASVSTGGYVSDTLGLQLDADWLKGQYGRDHSDTDVKNVRLRAEWWLAPDKLIKAEVGRYVADMDLAGALSPTDYDHSRRQSTRTLDEFSGRTTRASITYQQDLGGWGWVDRSQLTWTSFSAHSTRNFVVGMRRLPTETWRSDLPAQLLQSAPRDFRVYGTEPRLTFNIDSDTVSQTWTVGMRAMREDIDFIVGNTGLDNGVHTLVRDWGFQDRAWAAYVSNAIGLFDKRLTITPGLRYEHLDSTYRNNMADTRSTNNIRNVLPGLTVGYQFSPQWYGYADAQKSLRAPQVTQIVFGDNLDSELAWNYEAGVRYTPDDALNLSAALYRIDFKNQIELDNTTRTYGNLGKTRHQGLEFEAQWKPFGSRNWTLSAGYTFLDAKVRSGPYAGNQVPFASRHQFSLGARYSRDGTMVAVDTFYFSNSYSDKANTKTENSIASVGRMPSYWVWNAKVSQVLARNAGSTVTGTLAVNNLFDREYWFRGIDTSPWGRQPAPGRSVTVGLEATF